MEGSATSRRWELSLVNVAFCLGIVVFHCMSHPVTHLDKLSWQFALATVCQRLTCIGVPGFFFLSGLKFALPSPGSGRWDSTTSAGSAGSSPLTCWRRRCPTSPLS